MANRTYPNNYFSWYNDDQRLAILCEDTTSGSGARTVEKYDSFQENGNLSGIIDNFSDHNSTVAGTHSAEDSGTFTSLFIDNGLRITYKSKYETVSATTQNLDTDRGLDTSLHPQLVCYMKSRLYEDQGNFEQANYYRQMYENQMMKQKSRKSGVRGLAVPNL